MANRPRSRPAIPPLLKHLNERTVLEAIRAGAPISRAEISRRAGISKPTVSLALQSLLEAGLVRESAHDPDGPSYGAVFFEPVPDAALVLGLDLGARFLRGAICDLRGEIRARQDVELTNPDVRSALAAIDRLRASLVAATGFSADLIDGVVVGVPGVVDAASGQVHLTAFPGLDGMTFGDEVGSRLDAPIVVENDINLAALGERWLGVARGVDDFAFLSIGTGLGAGLVLHGELHRGRHGGAGELDFVSAGLEHDIDPCAGALSELAGRLAAERRDGSSLAPPYDPPAIFGAARSGDALARAVVEEEARRIALHIVPLAAVADVALIVLGGGIGANGDLLLGPVRRLLGEWLPYPPQVEASTLGEAAVLTGALAVGRRSALDSVFANRSTVPARALDFSDPPP
jgi:predicted NBD/HSP70 family sugar kinase/DNA-binding CsgD family transcriptional regulator